MNAIDRIFGSRADLPVVDLPTGVSRHDALAVERYERMLRSAPRTTIVQAHVEAFEKLTPRQFDLLFERFTAAAHEAERPHARPRTRGTSHLHIIAGYALSSTAWASWGGVYLGAGIWDDGGERW